jgi:hypothetical protein
MKTKISLFLVLLAFLTTAVFSQEEATKQSKEEKKLEKQKQVEGIVNARDFVFVARTANPSGMRSVNLATNPNFLKFNPDMIESEMPYFGKAYNSVGYGGDAGLKFKAKPEEFTVTKGKKNYDIKVIVKGEGDKYSLYLSVSFEGSATLSVISNNRSNISYSGEISAPEKSADKK